jgi:Transposase IS116/IS110/IS902 family
VIAPFGEIVNRLDTIPWINRRAAEVLVAELGADMTVFPSDRHLASWAGMCPGQHESAGKRQSGKTRKGNRWLRSVLVETALASIRKRDCALGSRYRRLLRHRGHKKAVLAIGHALLVTAYHLMARGTTYQELGANYDQSYTERITSQAVRALERQGYRVTLETCCMSRTTPVLRPALTEIFSVSSSQDGRVADFDYTGRSRGIIVSTHLYERALERARLSSRGSPMPNIDVFATARISRRNGLARREAHAALIREASMRSIVAVLCSLLATPAIAAAQGQIPNGEAVYKQHCAACHEGTMPRMPSRETLKSASPA